MLRARRVRPCRIRVQHSASGRDLFCIPVGPMVEGDRPVAHAAEWAEGWWCCWLSVPDLIDEEGPFSLVVESCTAAVPLELARERELHDPLMRPTLVKNDLTLGQLGGAVLRYLGRAREPLAVDIPL